MPYTIIRLHTHAILWPSFYSAAEAPVFMTGAQEGATSIRVYWFTTNPPRNVIGFRIYYRGPTNGSVDVDDPQAITHLLTGLKNNASYTIFIVSKSNHLPSERLESEPVKLGKTLMLMIFFMAIGKLYNATKISNHTCTYDT